MEATLGKTFGRSEHLLPLKGVGGDFSSASKSGSLVRAVRTNLHMGSVNKSMEQLGHLLPYRLVERVLHQAGIIQASSCHPSTVGGVRSEAGTFIQGNVSALGLTELLEIGRRNFSVWFLLR